MWPFNKVPVSDTPQIDIIEPDKDTTYLMYHNFSWYFYRIGLNMPAVVFRQHVNFFLERIGKPLVLNIGGMCDLEQWIALHKEIKKYYKEKYGEEI